MLPGGRVNDREAICAMLDRAGIPYRTEPTLMPGDFRYIPEGLADTSVFVAGHDTYDDRREQPYPGGYFGFFAEWVFDAAGALVAVWAWE